jgi:hypothetical protein
MITKQNILFSETPKHKLVRKEAPTTSKDSAELISSKARHLLKLVYDEINSSGGAGITTKEIRAKYPELAYSSITARPKTLEEEGLIYYVDGDVRERCRVMRIKL